jgi:integrase
LPRVGKPPRYPFLYPDEEAKLLACQAVPPVNRVLYGLLAREGTRGPSEAIAIPIHRIDFVHGTYGLGDNKTADPRGWVLGVDVAQALRIWVEHFHPDPKPESLIFLDPATAEPPEDSGHLAVGFRRHLLLAGVDRPELFEKSDIRRPIRAHDLRGTFITLALASGKSEQWVMDRSGHTTSAMLQRYRRAARTVAEAKMTTLVPFHLAIPEFAPFLAKTTATPPTSPQPQAEA